MKNRSNTEKLFIAGSVGRLQAILEQPNSAALTGAVLVCHPHPQHGGTMHNKVAHTLARTFLRMDFAALRFNFRGTEQSDGHFDDGVGELDDALVALDWLRERYPTVPIWLAGFSFGAAIAVRAATLVNVSGLISVAPAVARVAGRLDGQPGCAWLVVQGDEDELVAVDATIGWLNSLEPGPELRIFDGVEHFFHGRLIDLREAVAAFVEQSQGTRAKA